MADGLLNNKHIIKISKFSIKHNKNDGHNEQK